MSDVPTITINLDKRCAECGKGGAADSGLCLPCTAKSMRLGSVMKSHIGRRAQQRNAGVLADAKLLGQKLRGER